MSDFSEEQLKRDYPEIFNRDKPDIDDVFRHIMDIFNDYKKSLMYKKDIFHLIVRDLQKKGRLRCAPNSAEDKLQNYITLVSYTELGHRACDIIETYWEE